MLHNGARRIEPEGTCCEMVLQRCITIYFRSSKEKATAPDYYQKVMKLLKVEDICIVRNDKSTSGFRANQLESDRQLQRIRISDRVVLT